MFRIDRNSNYSLGGFFFECTAAKSQPMTDRAAFYTMLVRFKFTQAVPQSPDRIGNGFIFLRTGAISACSRIVMPPGKRLFSHSSIRRATAPASRRVAARTSVNSVYL